jgi:4-amino-4-deoxy-L-arabinose transferase-like glycosyltransferase
VIADPAKRRLPAWRNYLDRWARAIEVGGVAIVAAALFLFKLGTGALIDWDEAIYAEVSKEIVTGHQWLTLYWQHQPFFEKPPLSLWIRAALFQWVGVSESWARFPSAMAGIGIAFLTYAIARRWWGEGAGLFAAFVLLTMNHFDRVMREGTTDALLCLCIYLATYAYIRLRDGGAQWFYLLCAAVGAGAMTKGPAIVVVLAAIGIDWLVGRETRAVIGWRDLWLGALLLTAIVVPWHLWMVLHYGGAFFRDYFGYQLATRATETIEGSGGGPFFYFGVIFRGAIPWSIVAAFAATRWAWRREWERSLMWAMAGVTLALYSLIPTKHDWYILPVYPTFAVEVGGFLEELARSRRVIRYVAVAVLLIGIVAAFAKLVKRQGDPLANQMEEMARVAKASPDAGPLLVVTKAGLDPEADIPTAIFYSDRQAISLDKPADDRQIDAFLEKYHMIDAVIQRGAEQDLSQRFSIRPLAESDLLIYARISTLQ